MTFVEYPIPAEDDSDWFFCEVSNLMMMIWCVERKVFFRLDPMTQRRVDARATLKDISLGDGVVDPKIGVRISFTPSPSLSKTGRPIKHVGPSSWSLVSPQSLNATSRLVVCYS